MFKAQGKYTYIMVQSIYKLNSRKYERRTRKQIDSAIVAEKKVN